MPVQRTITYKALGLYTFPNQYGSPDGAMSSALNIFIDRPGVIEAARDVYPVQALSLDGGFNALNDIFPCRFSAAAWPFLVQEYNAVTPTFGNLFGINGQAIGGVQGTYSLATPTGAGSALSQRVISIIEANKNIYALTSGFAGGGYNGAWASQSAGPAAAYKIDSSSPSGQAMKTTGLGMPEPPEPAHYYNNYVGANPTYGAYNPGALLTNMATPTSNFGDSVNFATESRAYRVLFCRKDANGNLIRSAPSGRHIVYKPATNFGLWIFGIQNLYAGDIVQLYASETITAGANGTSTAFVSEPSDEMYQVYEYIVTSTDITNGYVTVNDVTPDAARGAALYTNATQDGILMGEQPPPPASLGAYFKNVAWYAGVSWRGYSSTILNILGTTGWSVTGGSATAFTIAGTTYTAAAVEDPPSHKFTLYGGNGVTTGTSVSQNNFMTARSLARAINYNNNKALAIVVSPPNATYAQILIKCYGNQGVGMGDQPGTITITGVNVPAGTITPANTSGSATSPSIATTYDSTLARLYYSRPNQPEAVPDVNYVVVGQPNSPITGLASLRNSLFVFKQEGLFRVTGSTAYDIRVETFDATVRMSWGQFRSIASAANQIFAMTSQGVVAITESGVSIVSRAIENLIQAYALPGNGQGRAWTSVGAASDIEKKYFLLLGGTSSAATLFVYNFANNTWTQPAMPSPAHTISMAINTTNRLKDGSSGSDQVVYSSNNSSTLSAMWDVTSIGQVGGNIGFTQASWTYCFAETHNPGLMRRYLDVTVIYQGSTIGSGINQGQPLVPSALSITFSSDSGAAATTQTIAPGSSYGCKVQVPKEHAYCGQLQMALQGPPAGADRFIVSALQVSFEEAGDRVFR